MKHFNLLAIIAIFLFVASCGISGQMNDDQQDALDSLLAVNAQQQMILDDMTAKTAEITMCLDTIAMYENMIVNRVDEEGNPLSRRGLREKLNTLSEIIKTQRERMAAMEESMAEGESSVVQLKSIIAYLNTSLEEKEAEIQQLKLELESKNINISQLNIHVTNLRDTVASVRQENNEQRQHLEEQNAQHELAINEVFYIIGTKEKLISNGVLSKSGMFRKSKINYDSIDKSVLTKADKRTLREIRIVGASPKILSDEPKGSYSIEKGASSSTLVILDADKFWSANNKILVVLVK